MKRTSILLLLVTTSALAQFRPPPPTEAERLSIEGDEYRLAANKALLEGDKARAKDRFTKAIESYKKALAANPKAVQAGVGLGEAASILGQHATVIEALTPLAAGNPESVEVAYYLGVSLLKSQRPEEAAPFLEKASEGGKPEHLLAHYYLGRYYLSHQRAQPAINVLTKYLGQRPAALAKNDPELHELLGQAHLLLADGKGARLAYERAQANRPEELGLQLGISAALELEGRHPDAIALLDGLLRRFPKAAEPRERLAWLALNAGDLAKAASAANGAIAIKESALSRYVAGAVELKKKAFANAERELKRAVQLDGRLLVAHLALAGAVQSQGRSDEAIAMLEALSAAGTHSVEFQAGLGSLYRRAGKFQSAVAAHRKVVELVPKKALGHVLLGADYYATGEWDQAIESYGRALELEANHANGRKWLALSLAHRAKARARSNLVDDAERDLRRAFDIHATASIARSLGAAMLTRQDFEGAQDVLSRGTKLPDAQWKDHLLLGYAYLGGKKPSEALTAFENAALKTTEAANTSDIYAGWALAKLELGDYDAAVAKLTEPGATGAARDVVSNNLPLALLRRALERLRTGDVEVAAKDIETVERIGKKAGPDVARLILVARALLDVEQARFKDASAALGRAFQKSSAKWERKHTKDLVAAYVAYRHDDVARARKLLLAVRKSLKSESDEFVIQMDRALDRREGEIHYSRGSIKSAAKILQKALAEDPLNSYVINNLACAKYQLKGVDEALASWKQLEQTLPVATLNLGIDAHVRQRDYTQAVARYAKYVATGTHRVRDVREWKERLQSLFAIDEPSSASAAETPSSNSEESAPSTAEQTP